FCVRFVLFKNITAINPDFYADCAVRHDSFCDCIVDISAEGLKRNTSELSVFCSTHSCSAKAAGKENSDSLHVAVGHNFLKHRLDHATERQTLLKTFDDHLSDDSGV